MGAGEEYGEAFEAAVQDVTAHLTSERQAWILGAGTSCQSGLPLMTILTELISVHYQDEAKPFAPLFAGLRNALPVGAHVEHYLSHLGDLIAIAERTRDQMATIGTTQFSASTLRELHGDIRDHIRSVIRRGYVPKQGDETLARVANDHEHVVHVDLQRDFVRTLFAARDKGGRELRPIQFFTLNYDTLLEDALALERIAYSDGFCGGGMAYWSPDVSYGDIRLGQRLSAHVVKLHGSIDWHGEEGGGIIRCREGCGYPARAGNVLIYPQSTKYMATQRDPFAALFERLRAGMRDKHSGVLAICGYSFGDDHVDLEIEQAMSRTDCRTVIVAFAQETEKEGKFQLPERLRRWLSTQPWCGRVFVLSDKGIYHGNPTNLYTGSKSFDWWTFAGVTKLLNDGPRQFDASAEPEASAPADAPAPVVDGGGK